MIPTVLKPMFEPMRKYYLPHLMPLIRREPETDPELAKILPLFKADDVVIEVGGNVGGSTIKISPLVKEIHSFEPNPVAFRIWKSYTKHLQNVRGYNFALSDHESHEMLSGSTISRCGTIVSESIGVPVEVRTLDSFNLHPTAILVDCEGSETNVLSGAKRTLESVRLVCVESHVHSKYGSTAPALIDRLRGWRTTVLETRKIEPTELWLWENILAFHRT